MMTTFREGGRLNPASATYYEHRVFMVYFPNDFRDYLGRMVTGERDWMRTRRALDLMAWGTVLVYQARMEPFRFNEVLSRYYEGGGNFRKGYDEEGTPLWQPMFRLQLTMQLAQEVVTKFANIEVRIDEFPNQAQLLFDTFHYVTALHDRERPPEHVFSISESDFRNYLRRRAENDRGPGLDLDFPGSDQLTFLLKHLWDYLNLLANPVKLREEVLIDSRQLQRSPQERQLRTRLLRAILPDHTPVIGDLVPSVWPGAAANDANPAPTASDERIKFRFLLNRFGIGPVPKDPLDAAREADAALDSWERLLSELLGNPTTGQKTAAIAGILDGAPTWDAIARARALLADHTEAMPTDTGPRPEVEERERRFAAVQLQGALEMLQLWRDAFWEGIRAATVAALAVPDDEWPARRRIAVQALGAFCRLDLKEQPADVLKFLKEDLAWPSELAAATPQEGEVEDSGSLGSFVDTPMNLQTYCNDLTALARASERQTTSIDWPSLWRNFWSQCEFLPTGVSIRRPPQVAHPAGTDADEGVAIRSPLQTSVATGMAVLHAARHGGIPVVPSLPGNLSIGQWWRLVTLAIFGDESIPDGAVAAALRALGFPEDFERLHRDSLSDFRAHPAGDVPVLFIYVASSGSPAWLWPPDSRVGAIMPPPRDVLLADHAAIENPTLVDEEFHALKQKAMTRERSAPVRFLLRALFRLGQFLTRTGRGSAWLFRWLPSWMIRLGASLARALRNWPIRIRRARSFNFVECREVGPDTSVREFLPVGPYVYFGFGPAPEGITGYIAAPTGVADLLQRIRDTDQARRSARAIRLPFGLEWRHRPNLRA
jgi:hypothetical protein